MSSIVHHVGLVVHTGTAYKVNEVLEEVLGKELGWKQKDIPEFGCTCTMRDGVEYVVPYEGPLLEWLDNVGDGSPIHHFAIEVDDIEETCERLRENGLKLVCDEPVEGVGGMLVNFIHPAQLGVMIEIVQEAHLDNQR